MRPLRVVVVLGVATGLALGLAGCATPAPVEPAPTMDTRPADRDRLAALAAAAKDHRYVATYTWSSAGRPDRTVTAAFAADGTWVVSVPGGALSGLADIAIYYSGSALHQCLLRPVQGTAGTRPDLDHLTPSCVPVDSLSPAEDPRVHHVFTDWIDAFVDRATALSVTTATLDGATGSCFSVESTSAALAPPVDPGIYCYADDGTLTGARTSFGTLLLAGPVEAAPPSVALPAPVVPGS
ncbi:MAG: hypothetical protein IRY85_06370, partial [Micromonosporaceae bacterium]|nr:hypothetical protein [Micromonosporaceae bacterium]